MNILLPIDSSGESLSKDFTLSEFFGVYDSGSKELIKYKLDKFKEKYPEKSFIEIINSLNIDRVVIPNYNPMVFNLFNKNNIATYESNELSLNKNIELIELDKLTPMMFENIERSGCSSGACSSCSSSTCN